jgi:hypothetical protein
VDIPLVFGIINTGVEILVGEMPILRLQKVLDFEIGLMCHLVDVSLEGVCHSRHCNYHDWLMG